MNTPKHALLTKVQLTQYSPSKPGYLQVIHNLIRFGMNVLVVGEPLTPETGNWGDLKRKGRLPTESALSKVYPAS
jgi:hypothetical protein